VSYETLNQSFKINQSMARNASIEGVYVCAEGFDILKIYTYNTAFASCDSHCGQKPCSR